MLTRHITLSSFNRLMIYENVLHCHLFKDCVSSRDLCRIRTSVGCFSLSRFSWGLFPKYSEQKNGDTQVHFQGNIQGYKKHSKNFRDMPNTITAVTESSILGTPGIWFPGPSYHANNEKVAGLGPYHVLPLKFNTTLELTPGNIESPTKNSRLKMFHALWRLFFLLSLHSLEMFFGFPGIFPWISMDNLNKNHDG